MLHRNGCLQLQVAGVGFVRNHATTTKLHLHLYGVDERSVIHSLEQQNVSDHLGSHIFGIVVWRVVGYLV